MTKEETTATWQGWLIDAIHKIRYQKQRPNVERVASCIRMHHPQYSNEAVEQHLEECVRNGSVQKVVNKGLTSYRDPGSAPGRGQKTLHISAADMDLSKVSPTLVTKHRWTDYMPLISCSNPKIAIPYLLKIAQSNSLNAFTNLNERSTKHLTVRMI